jgi:hypothetical protein
LIVKKIHLFGGKDWSRVHALGPWAAVVEVEPALPEGGAAECTLHGERVILSTPQVSPPRGLSALVYRGASPPSLAIGDVIEEVPG